jgi:hypothetical protein
MTKGTLRTRDAIESAGSAMFVMTNGAGSILDHIQLMEIIVSLTGVGLAASAAFLLGQIVMAFLALAVDGIEVNALVKSVA